MPEKEKALAPKEVTEEGIFMVTKLLQLEKQQLEIADILLGKITSHNKLH